MKREKCKQCGACCNWWVYFEDRRKPLSKEMIERMKISGVRSFLGEGKNKRIRAIYVPNKCQAFDTFTNRCMIHGKKKPTMCRRFPLKGMAYILPNSCVHVHKDKYWYAMKDFKEEF